MTVHQSIAAWLNGILTDSENGFPPSINVIDIENIPEIEKVPGQQGGSSNSGLFSSPNDIHSQLLDGRTKHTIFRSWYLRMDILSAKERERNEEYFEKLRECIDLSVMRGDYPDDGRGWLGIAINGGVYPAQRDSGGSRADYLVPLKLVFIK